MHKKTLYVALVAFLVFNTVDAKKTRRIKRPKSEDDTTPQPNVVTYSTFGFNDVGSYDGFVPSSPDYANYLNRFKQDSSSKLYAPAFPTAMDSVFSNDYGSQTQDTRSFGIADNSGPQASMLQYPQSTMSFYNTPTLDNEAQSQNLAPEEIYGHNTGEVNSPGPIYGAKLSSKNRNKSLNQYNNTDYNVFSSGSQNPSDVKFTSFQDMHQTYESKPTSFGEPTKSYQSSQFQRYPPTYPSAGMDSFMKSVSTNSQSSLKFPKVIDFTSKFKQYYPSNPENKYNQVTPKPSSVYNSQSNGQNENIYTSNFEDNVNNFPNPTQTFKNMFNKEQEVKEVPQKETTTHHPYTTSTEYSQNYIGVPDDKDLQNIPKFNYDYKDKYKYKPWASTNYTNDYKTWKNPIKGYQYSTNFSNMNFEFDFSGGKKPVNDNMDEVISASSNIFDSAYQFPETDYTNFKKIPAFKDQTDDDLTSVIHSLKQQDYKYEPEEYVRTLYSTVPTTTSHWGNIYKTSDYSSYRNHLKKPQLIDEINDDIVHIPKRPYGTKYNFPKYLESKPNEFSSYVSRPHKPKRPSNDRPKETYNIRFKSEEDLLGLRTHDTSHPSYLPTYRPSSISNNFASDYDYKKLVEKWRQSYLKAKYKDTYGGDFDSYPSEPKPMHVPVPKPYAIEIPHPVIVPVPEPYPVRVPVPKPVAVPVIRELKIPVEKPVPYPVYKNVPYPVEKLVPVPVEKEVQVPVIKPFPVPIPHIRPVFHHTRTRDEADTGMDVDDDDDDYLPRPESSKKTIYAKRPTRGSRTRSRKPSRPSYYDRNRRRWPARRPSASPEQRPRRPGSIIDSHYSQPLRHDFDSEDFDHDPSDYFAYCKRTGNC